MNKCPLYFQQQPFDRICLSLSIVLSSPLSSPIALLHVLCFIISHTHNHSNHPRIIKRTQTFCMCARKANGWEGEVAPRTVTTARACCWSFCCCQAWMIYYCCMAANETVQWATVDKEEKHRERNRGGDTNYTKAKLT